MSKLVSNKHCAVLTMRSAARARQKSQKNKIWSKFLSVLSTSAHSLNTVLLLALLLPSITLCQQLALLLAEAPSGIEMSKNLRLTLSLSTQYD
jgi:hypothetical protein